MVKVMYNYKIKMVGVDGTIYKRSGSIGSIEAFENMVGELQRLSQRSGVVLTYTIRKA